MNWYRNLPKRTRNILSFTVKALVTVGGFYLLLTHPVDGGEGVGKLPIYRAISDYIGTVDASTFLLWSGVAMAVKFSGVLTSALSWHMLLKGQGLRFPFWQQVVTAFLIGRFIGTFLPSTIGLDGYTLYEAGRYSNQWHRAVTAKALEKFIGIAGLFTGLLLTLPAGYAILDGVAGESALGGLSGGVVLTVLIGGLSASVTIGVIAGLTLLPYALRLRQVPAVAPVFKVIDTVVGHLPGFARRHGERFVRAATAYEGKVGLILGALLAKFITHFTTAMVYFFTAMAIGVAGVAFLPIVFGSLIQILGTLFSPTIAGEGAREALQALLLSAHLGGAAQAVLSAALGFVAAEAATMWGGLFLWVRGPHWRPTYVEVDGQQVDYAWLSDDDDARFDANALARHTS